MLQHASLETRPDDVEAALSFWAILGFEHVDPPPSLQGRAVWVQRAGTQVHLLLTLDPVAAPKGHVAVVVDAYDEALDGLRSHGYEVEDRRRHWGAARAMARAPGGHLVEVMSAPPGDAAVRTRAHS